jgi:hypothetical protein
MNMVAHDYEFYNDSLDSINIEVSMCPCCKSLVFSEQFIDFDGFCSLVCQMEYEELGALVI